VLVSLIKPFVDLLDAFGDMISHRLLLFLFFEDLLFPEKFLFLGSPLQPHLPCYFMIIKLRLINVLRDNQVKCPMIFLFLQRDVQVCLAVLVRVTRIDTIIKLNILPFSLQGLWIHDSLIVTLALFRIKEWVVVLVDDRTKPDFVPYFAKITIVWWGCDIDWLWYSLNVLLNDR
jgi:hypothetical protein